MDKNYNYTEIEQYVKAELTEAELRKFEKKLSQDMALKEEVDFYKQLAEVSVLQGLFEEAESEMAEVEEENEEEEESIKPTSKKEATVFSFSRRIISLAASFLVLVFAGWWIYSADSTSSDLYTELAGENFVHYPAQASRGSTEHSTLYDNYKNKNYQSASVELEKHATTEKDLTAQLYASISYLALDQPRKTVDLLEGMEGVESLNNRKQYYLGLAYLQLGQKEKALIAFKQVNEVDAFLYKKAINILKNLEQ